MAEIKDVAPEMLEKVLVAFRKKVENNAKIKQINKKINKEDVNMEDAAEYAKEIGESLVAAFSLIKANDLPDGRMYYNIANRVIRIPLEEADLMVEDITSKTLEILNRKANIGLKVII